MPPSQVAPLSPSAPAPAAALAVTTCVKPLEPQLESARQLAEETGYPLLVRTRRTLARTAAEEGLDGLVIVEREGLALWVDGQILRHHPNMAKLRMLALQQGKKDVLVDALQLSTGDRVLDCTCGLGADAVVAAYAVGPSGSVRALESAPLLALLTARGMASCAIADPAELAPTMRRVEVRAADFADYLRREADGAWDVVYFDPMFTATVDEAHGLDLVRHLARPGGPTAADLDQARRVARRRVVMKDRLPGPELERLGFTQIQRGRRVCYGVLDAA